MSNTDPQPTRLERELFDQLLELETREERQATLDRLCAGNAPLRARLDALLRVHDEATGFLPEQPQGLVGTPTSEVSASRAAPTGAGDPQEGPGMRIGRYKLLEQIGEGGCGVVYMADQEQPVRRRVALKVIRLGMDTRSVIARFEAERQALALMDHPNIAKVLDAGATESGRPYFVMELVRGLPITRYCDEARLGTAGRLELFVKVCQAIQHAHQKGIVHRDIKPSNILVTIHDGVAVPKVIDFGIAKATHQQPLTEKTLFTAFQQFVGTPAYMSPEQAGITSDDIDTRSDIYSLGVLLYELLTGRTPFDGRDLLAAGLDVMRRTIREVEPARPSNRLRTLAEAELSTVAQRRHTEVPRLLQALQGDLDWIVMKALDKDRNRRYESANGFAQDVLRHLQSEPVIARPPSAGYRLRKAIARHRFAFAAGLAVFAALALGLGISTRLYLQKSAAFQEQARERARAEAATERANAEAATAEAARREAEHQRRAAVTNLVNLHVAEGWRRSEDGDYFGALGQFQAAREQEKGDAEREAVHQLRLSAVWQLCPKLLQEFSVGTHLTGAEFDSDGSRLLLATSLSPTQAVARVWNPFAGEPLAPAMEHSGTIHSVAWGAAETRVVTASEDGTAKLWESRSGRLVMPPFRHTNGVTRATLDPLGRWIATATWGDVLECDPQAAVSLFSLNGTEGEEPLRIRTRRTWAGTPLLFTSDGTRLITHLTVVRLEESKLPKVEIYPLHHRNRIGSLGIDGVDPQRWHFMEGSTRSVISDLLGRGFSADGFPEHSALFRLDTGEALQAFENVALAQDGVFCEPTRTLHTLHADSTVRTWDAGTGRAISSFAVPGPTPESLVASAQGNAIALSQADGTVTIRAPGDGRLLLPPLPHPGRVVRMKFAREDAYLVTVGREGWVKVWDLRTPQSLVTLVAVTNATSVTVKRPSRDGVLPIVWELPSGTAVACRWNIENYARTSPMLHFPEPKIAWWGERWIRTTRDNGDGLLQIEQASGEVRSMQADKYREITFIEGNPTYGLISRFDPVNQTVCVVQRDTLTEVFRAHAVEWAWWWGRENELLVQQTNGTLEVWDVASSNRLGVLEAKSDERLNEVISGADGDRVLTLGKQGAQLWSAKTREAESPLIRFPVPWKAKADPSLDWIAYPRGAAGVSCHHLRDGTERRIAVPRGFTAQEVFALTPDLLLAVAASGNACLIHVPSGEWVVAAVTFPSAPSSIAVDADAGVAYVGCADGRVVKWTLPAAKDPGDLWATRTLGLLGTAYVAPGSYRASKSNVDTHTTHTSRPRNPVSKTSGESQAIVTADWHLRRAESLGKTGLWGAALAHLESFLEGNAEPSELRLRWADLYAAAVRAGGVDSLDPSASVRVHQVGVGTTEPRNLTLSGGTWKESEDSALAAYRQAADWYHRQGDVGLMGRNLALERRSALSADLGRYAESLQDLRVARGLPAEQLVALNDALDLAPWFGENQIQLDPSSAFRVPRDVVFKVEGCIEPSMAELLYLDQEWMTKGILVGRQCRFLHFLIGCRAEDCCAVSGTLVGKLAMHLRGGQVHEQEIVYGRDLLDLRKPEREESTPVQAQPPPAWSGRAAVPPDAARDVRLYALTWTNPIPGGEVVRLDFKAGNRGIVPMLFAVTAEP